MESRAGSSFHDEEVSPSSDGWSNTDTPFPDGKLLHQLFDERVAESPESVAASFQDRSITYCELSDESRALAAHLRLSGVEVGNRVPIVMPRSLDLVIAQLAVSDRKSVV